MNSIIENILLLDNEIKTIFIAAGCPLLFWLLATLGFTFGITHSKLTFWFSLKIAFLRCPQCVAFWCGIFVFLLDSGIFNLAFSASFCGFFVYYLLAKSLKENG